MPNPELPHAREKLPGWIAARARAGRFLLALDYDGTLSPIVDRPERAELPAACAAALARIARRADTTIAVISGRALEDVRERVGLPGIYYAGNHGAEIRGPDLLRTLPEATAARPRLEACRAALEAALGSIPGVVVEDKGLGLAVHYRRVPEAEQPEVRRRALDECAGREGLRFMESKKVVEVRPDVDWHKGRALEFLLDTLSAGAAVPAVFIGDDVTDEDGFRALRGRGDGVLVAEQPPIATAAAAWLRSPEEVVEILTALGGAP